MIAAYQSQCAFCHLKHAELLDAAHIIPDKEEEGIPSVNNGLALCKIHHAAFDKHILGVTPDYEIKVKDEVLREEDGPMLLHGIQELQDKKLILPRSKKAWPNQEFLEWRYEMFREVG
ncbi:MAG: HNH endonuclease [Balneolaceae bacterium]|nr:HNH endonuclease [Balneolaceae bacterium]